MKRIICLDVGGTVIKNCVMDEKGGMHNRVNRPVNSKGGREEILSAFSDIVQEQMAFVRQENGEPAGIGIAIGGPFDWENGISLLRNLNKFDSIYGVNIKKYLYETPALPRNIPVLFEPDIWSFTRGEIGFGAGKQEKRGVCFTIGTGLGSCFFAGGLIVNEGPGIPWYGWIAGQKYREGLLDDYISGVYIKKRYEHFTGLSMDVSEIAKLAFAGDIAAAGIFMEMGEELAGFLKFNNLPEFKPECLIFGGQLSKSFPLFAGPLIKLIHEFDFLKRVKPAADIDNSSMKGLYALFFEENHGNAV